MPNFTPTTNAVAIPTIIAQEVIRLMPGYMSLAKFVSKDTDWTGQDFATYGQTLDIVKPGALTVSTKTAGTAMSAQSPTATKVSVVLNQHKYIDVLEEDITKLLQKPDLQAAYARHGYQARRGCRELSVLASPKSHSTVSFDKTSATTVAASCLRLRSKFARNKVPQAMPKGAFLDTSIIDELLKIDKYSRGDYIGNTEAVNLGAIRRIYNINIFESQLVPTSGSPVAYHNVATTPYGFVLVNRPMPLDGNGKGVRQTNMRDPNTGITFRLTEGYSHADLGSRFTIDVIYGAAVCDSTQVHEVEST